MDINKDELKNGFLILMIRLRILQDPKRPYPSALKNSFEIYKGKAIEWKVTK